MKIYNLLGRYFLGYFNVLIPNRRYGTNIFIVDWNCLSFVGSMVILPNGILPIGEVPFNFSPSVCSCYYS